MPAASRLPRTLPGMSNAWPKRKEELANCQAARDRLDQSWRELWTACRLSPKSPETMVEWLRLHGQLVRSSKIVWHWIAAGSKFNGELSTFEAELRKAIGIEGQPEELLAEAEQRAQQARDASLQIARLERDLPAGSEELEQLRREREESAGSKSFGSGRWQDLLERTWLSSGMG